ncbi:hypothetical protein [Streptobacillus moniliformis]|uniref:hypothetical protein n=1 Tax=Streptobacillus moniliformis TaxID=34105 RepID=UPI0007E2E9E2|nr:hypothetical protein [Streptobacillus moniliformis]
MVKMENKNARDNMIANLEGILNKLKTNNIDEYDNIQIFNDLTSTMGNISKSFDEVVNDHIIDCFNDLENVLNMEEFKETGDISYLIDRVSNSVYDDFIFYDKNEKLKFDFEYIHSGDFYYDTLENIQETYDKDILNDSNKFIPVLISNGVNSKLHEMLDELNIDVNVREDNGIEVLNQMIDYINEKNDISLDYIKEENSWDLKKDDKECEMGR